MEPKSADKDLASPGSDKETSLPAWALELIGQYESGSRNQFILHGNVHDRLILPLKQPELGSLHDFLIRILMPSFDVVLNFDLGNGIRIDKGGETFTQWPAFKGQDLPRAPRPAIETLTHYFRYTANLARLGKPAPHVGCIIRDAHLLAPALPQGLNYDLNALAFLMRDWSSETLLTEHALVTFLVAENLNDLHPLLVNHPRASRIKVPLPESADLASAFRIMAPRYPTALAPFKDDHTAPAEALRGATLASIESLLKTKEHANIALAEADLSKLKKELIENDCNGLIEFIEPKKNLDALYGQEKIKTWIRQDIELWRKNDIDALPKGYLICGPVGTGKTFMVECIAGEAAVPVVKLKNFRDKWVGSTESNLEKIFRLLRALGRCYVFIDEADQTMGKRDSGSNDSGLSGRVYSMLAQEMSDSENRGKIIWVLATSRPDLVEVDLKRPGRVDVKIPIFPTTTPKEGYNLIRALCKRRGVEIDETLLGEMEAAIPDRLTPGAAEALSVKIYRLVKVKKLKPIEALAACLQDYQPPVDPKVMAFQIELAIKEASDLEFVPKELRQGTFS